MARRLEPILSHAEYHLVFARANELGMAGVYIGHAVEFEEPYGRVIGLIVDESLRRQAVRRSLMAHIEELAKARGAVMLTVTSGSHRGDAHRFSRL
jgi:GNAT superfamily N-acetyltransferase